MCVVGLKPLRGGGRAVRDTTAQRDSNPIGRFDQCPDLTKPEEEVALRVKVTPCRDRRR